MAKFPLVKGNHLGPRANYNPGSPGYIIYLAMDAKAPGFGQHEMNNSPCCMWCKHGLISRYQTVCQKHNIDFATNAMDMFGYVCDDFDGSWMNEIGP